MVIQSRASVLGLWFVLASLACADDAILCGWFVIDPVIVDNGRIPRTNSFHVLSAVTDSNRVKRILDTADSGMFEWDFSTHGFIPMSRRIIDLVVYDLATHQAKRRFEVTDAHITLYPEAMAGRSQGERNLKIDGDGRMADILGEVMKEFDTDREWDTMRREHSHFVSHCRLSKGAAQASFVSSFQRWAL